MGLTSRSSSCTSDYVLLTVIASLVMPGELDAWRRGSG